MFKRKSVYAIVLAGGGGSRFGGDMPKQFHMLGDAPVFMHSTRKFDTMGIIDGIVLVVPPQYFDHCQNLAAQYGLAKISAVVFGGDSRQKSTYNGLCALDAYGDSIVLVHDAARPFVCEADAAALVDAANAHGAAVLALPVTDTIKLADGAHLAAKTIDRENLYAAKTPQAALLACLMAAHRAALQSDFTATDDCQLLENIGIYPKIVISNIPNIKITTARDLDFAAFLLERGVVHGF
ncbi:MAG: 2-C-methyl-D-erythritol 4-phosphate cytidylyltransferase [Clostridiales bacterium]|jgi:2-C-methyl-D-erythritol 4-phosphate cytidylyltransferase|nr:2-C-methyl-D-erythritol 4-phosphate cytidylyltransferase [Clostridiales bacterium]